MSEWKETKLEDLGTVVGGATQQLNCYLELRTEDSELKDLVALTSRNYYKRN